MVTTAVADSVVRSAFSATLGFWFNLSHSETIVAAKTGLQTLLV